MIILEGTDNTGKSTLAKRLVEDLNYLHSDKPFSVMHSPGPMDKRSKMVMWLMNEIEQAPKPFIYDRVSVISDMIYSPIVRNEPSFYEISKVEEHIKETIRLMPHVIVFCRPSDKAILADNGRDQMDGVYDNHHLLITAYDKKIKEYIEDGFNVITYNHELGDTHYQEILRHVHQTIQVNPITWRRNIDD